MNDNDQIPRLHRRFFKWFCRKELYDELEGDLMETFAENEENFGKSYAIKKYKKEVWHMIRPSVFARPRLKTQTTALSKAFNYTIVAARNARNQLGYYFINFFGLTLGLTCCALVTLYVKHELSYDDFHKDTAKIHRVITQHAYASDDTWFPNIDIAYSDQLISGKIPGISSIVRLVRAPSRVSTYKDKSFTERGVLFVEKGSRFLDLFGFQVQKGNADNILDGPNQALMTSSTAIKYFGNEDPINKIIQFDSLQIKVTGVIEDIPTNSHFDFDMIVTNSFFIQDWIKQSHTYFKVDKKIEVAHLAHQIESLEVVVDANARVSKAFVEPIGEVHLRSNVSPFKPGGSIATLWAFSIIAALVLVISCANYVNISAAIYSKRNVEAGMRKVMGSTNAALRYQFLLEGLMISLLTLPFVLLLVETLLPYFNNFLAIELKNYFVNTLSYAFALLVITIVTGLLAGIYPALILSKMDTLSLLRKKGGALGGGVKMRKVLMTLQFTVLMFLGLGSYFVNKQLQYVNGKDIGIDRDGVLKIERAYGLKGKEHIKAFKNELLADPNVLMVSQGQVAGDGDYPSDYQPEGEEVRTDALYNYVDFDYLTLLEIEGVAGPYFSEKVTEHPESSLLVNQAFVENLGWTIDEAIGKYINTNPKDTIPHFKEIRGVFEDFNFFSLREEPSPYMFHVQRERKSIWFNVLIKINMSDPPGTMNRIEEVWNEFAPNSPFNLEFINDDLQKAYSNDQKLAVLSTSLSTIAILLSVLGLVGLSSYITELQKKAIGIKKVLGASVKHLIYALNKDYLVLILIANIISCVVAYYFVNHWLDDFAYRTEIDYIPFFLAGLAVTAITFLTVSFQSIKTANSNPVEVLRNE